MNINNYQYWGLLLGLLVTLGGCSQSPSDKKQVIARVNGEELTADQYRQQGFFYTYLSHLQINDPKQRLQAMVESELLLEEAKKQNLEDSPDVRKQIQTILITKLLRNELGNKEHQTLPTDQEAQDYFQKHADRFQSPETVHYAHILLSGPDQKANQELAAKILKDPALNQPTRFKELAQQYSADKMTAANGGDLGFALVPDGKTPSPLTASWQAKLTAAAVAIKEVGQVNPQPVQTERGLHIVKLLGHEPARSLSFAEVRPQVLRQIMIERQTKAYRDLVESLKAKADVSIDQAAIDDLTKSGALTIPPMSNGMSPGMNGMPMGGPSPGMFPMGRPMMPPPLPGSR